MPGDGMSHERDPEADYFPEVIRRGVLHEDRSEMGVDPENGRPTWGVTAPGVVRNLTAEEYAATYADGEPHPWPPTLQELQAEWSGLNP